MSTPMKDKETKGFGRIAKRIRGPIEDFVVSLAIDSLDGDGRAERLKRLIREIEQLEQEAEKRGYEIGKQSARAELSISENMEKVEGFFREAPIDYDDKCNLWNDFLLKLLEEENGKQNER